MLAPEKKELSELQKCIIETLSAFHDFCEENNLNYYMTGGTLLGAVRHKGIIPWDDDVDVCMPRPDYKRLIELAGKLPEGYSIGYFELDRGYVYPFAKLYNGKLLVKESFGCKSYTGGAWVDIFPLDATFSSSKLSALHFWLIKMLRSLFELKVRGYQAPRDKRKVIRYHFKKVIKIIAFSVLHFVPVKILFWVMESLAGIIGYDKSERVARLYSGYGKNATFDKEVYIEKVLLEFNGYKFYAPAGYHEYLTTLYGDYMTPPPPKERRVHNIQILT